VRAGLTPIEAIRAATKNPKEVLGVADSGVIAVGQRADLVVLDASPLDNISNIRRVRWTVIGGRVLDPNRLWKLVDIQGEKSTPPQGAGTSPRNRRLLMANRTVKSFLRTETRRSRV